MSLMALRKNSSGYFVETGHSQPPDAKIIATDEDDVIVGFKGDDPARNEEAECGGITGSKFKGIRPGGAGGGPGG